MTRTWDGEPQSPMYMDSAQPVAEASRAFVRAANGLSTVFTLGESATISYSGYHYRVSRLRGKPSLCEECGTTDPAKRYEWASLSHNYADPNDYKRMCRPCHMRFDDIHARVGEQLKGRSFPHMQGARHHQAKLTEANVRDIRSRWQVGMGYAALGREFGVAGYTIRRIVERRNWRNVE